MDTQHDYSTIYCQSCGHTLQIPVRCGRRFCAVCSRSAAARAHARMSFICNNMKKRGEISWKFMTLTIKSGNELEPMIEALITGFRKLRNRKTWKTAVTGGLYVIEITHSLKGWHAHLHLIVMCRYIPQHHLSAIWCSITGSKVVDIRLCKGPNPIGYITHYLAKFDIPECDLAEAENAVRNRRLWSPFGAAHSINQRYKPAKVPCPSCGGLYWIREQDVRILMSRASSDP